MKQNQIQKFDRFLKAALIIGILIFLAGITLFAYAGTFSRFWADDYCYTAMVKQNGLFNGLVKWYLSGGNRVSTLVVVAFADLFGWKSIEFSPLIVLILWTSAWIFFLTQLARLFQWHGSRYWLALLSLVEVYFAVLLAPDRLQTLFWRMGTDHYTLPIPLLLLILGMLVHASFQTGKRLRWVGPASAALSFFAAGLSETYAALQTGVLALVLAAVVIFSPGEKRRPAIGWCSAALASSLLMMGVMALSPANAFRQDVLPPPSNLLLILPYSLRYAADFIVYTLRGQSTSFLVYFALLVAIGLLAVPTGQMRMSLRMGLAGASVSLLIMYALIVCSFAPSAYAGLSYPAGRALMPGSFALLTGLGCAALFMGYTLRFMVSRTNQNWLLALAVAMLVVLSLYPFHVAVVARKDIARLSVWAARWDTRDQQIRQSAAAGNRDIVVRQVEVVRSLEDIGPDPTQWVNKCAADFYDAHTITATP